MAGSKPSSRPGDDPSAFTPNATRDPPPALARHACGLHLWQRLKLLLLLNSLPILATAWLGWHASQGSLRLTVEAAPLIWLVVAVLGACAAILVALWVVLPVARWLAAYPTWCFQNRQPLVWALPCLLGHVLAMLLTVVVLGLIGVAIAVIVIGLRDLSQLEPTEDQPVLRQRPLKKRWSNHKGRCSDSGLNVGRASSPD